MQYVLAKMLFATKRLQQSPGFDSSLLKNILLCGDDEVQAEDPDLSKSDDDLRGIAGN